jgi:coproporphyrinogen III oxidase
MYRSQEIIKVFNEYNLPEEISKYILALERQLLFENSIYEWLHFSHLTKLEKCKRFFYEDFNERDFNHSFELTKSIGQSLLNAYLPIVQKRKDVNFNDYQKQFQLFRRSRYVEFNLLQDRGTLFGIQSKGRVESILMSMPPLVKWTYDFTPTKGSDEEKLYTNFLIKKNWVY